MQGLGQKLAFTQLATVQNPAASLLFAVIILCAVVVVWAAMMVRKMTLLISAVLAPLAFAGATAEITRSWVRKWIEFVCAMVASKLLLVIIPRDLNNPARSSTRPRESEHSMRAVQPDEYLTSSQVAVLLRTTQGTVGRWARNGQIPGMFVDGRWLIPRRRVTPARSWASRLAPTRRRTPLAAPLGGVVE